MSSPDPDGKREPLLGAAGRGFLEALAAWRMKSFLFDDSGRIGRRALWAYLGAAMALAFVIFFWSALRRSPLAHVGFAVVLLYPSYCVFAKRFQDFGVNGGWAVVIMLVSAIDALLGASGLKARPGRFETAIEAWEMVGLANMLFVFAVLGLWPGNQGANRFGLRWPPW